MREMWINGALRAGASGQTIPVQDPATEEIIDQVPAGNAEDVRAAVDAASAAFRDWRRLSAGERAEMLHEIAAKLTAKTEELATLLTREGGKPLVENRDEMSWSAACFRYYAELGRNTRGRVIPSIEPSQLALVLSHLQLSLGLSLASESRQPLRWRWRCSSFAGAGHRTCLRLCRN